MHSEVICKKMLFTNYVFYASRKFIFLHIGEISMETTISDFQHNS